MTTTESEKVKYKEEMARYRIGYFDSYGTFVKFPQVYGSEQEAIDYMKSDSFKGSYEASVINKHGGFGYIRRFNINTEAENVSKFKV